MILNYLCKKIVRKYLPWYLLYNQLIVATASILYITTMTKYDICVTDLFQMYEIITGGGSRLHDPGDTFQQATLVILERCPRVYFLEGS